MDRKIIIFIIAMLTLVGCKENKWMDWKVQNEMWLEQNIANDPQVHETASGLQYKIIADPGALNGEAIPNSNSIITCDYRIRLINGYVLQYEGPTFGGKESATFNLSNCIPGFTEGCHLIHSSGDIILFIPAYLGYDYQKYEDNDAYNAEGYGTEGTQSYIPPYSTLIYEIHLCAVSGQ